MLRSESLLIPLRLPGPIPIVGGKNEKALKKENGARLRVPSAATVETQAIGRGATSPLSSALSSRRPSSAGSMITAGP